MPKNETGQGNSANTPIKQDAFRYFMAVHTEIVRLITVKPRDGYTIDPKYYYIDTNAGTGFNGDGTDGSMRIAYSAIAERFSGAFICGIEKNPEAALKLRAEMVGMAEHFQNNVIKAIHGENQKILMPYLLTGCRTGLQYGLVYADPNGVDDFPLTALEIFFTDYHARKLDVLINIGATILKRCRAAGLEKFVLNDVIDRIDKDYWYIRDHVGRDQWTFLFGTNWDSWPALQIKVNGLTLSVTKGNLRALGMYCIHPDPTPEALRIWEEATLTKKEALKKNPEPYIGPIENTSNIQLFWTFEQQ